MVGWDGGGCSAKGWRGLGAVGMGMRVAVRTLSRTDRGSRGRTGFVEQMPVEEPEGQCPTFILSLCIRRA